MRLIKIWEADMEKAYKLQNSFQANEDGFVNSAYGYMFDEFVKYTELCKDYSVGKNLPEGYVPATTYILENDEGEYVGIFNFRHHLNEVLANGSGHIGYGISPNCRRRGYATSGLSLVLQEAKKMGVEEAYMSCFKYNKGSLKTQLNNGAVIHHEDDDHYYTRTRL